MSETTIPQLQPPTPAQIKDKGLTFVIAKWLTDNKGLHFARGAGGCLYLFEGGVYRPTADDTIKKLTREFVEHFQQSDRWRPNLPDAVAEYLRAGSPELWDQPLPSVLNLKNGLLNVESSELLRHTHEYLSCVQLPVDYDAKATCSAWEQFVPQVFPSDAKDVAYEIVAWLMMPDVSIQKAVLLLGPGGNGKSTYLTAVTAFLGAGNTSQASLHKLSERFGGTQLVGKLANICADLPSRSASDTSLFKAITGGDRIAAEYKYGAAFHFCPYARLLFSANQPPRSRDADEAYFDRWIVIPFSRSFRGTDAEVSRPRLDAQLAAPAELSGVLNKALAVLQRVRHEGLTESPSMREALKGFRRATDPLAVWLDTNTVEGADAWVPKDLMRDRYNAQAQREDRPTISAESFGQGLKTHRPHVTDAQKTVNGKPRRHVYVGIGLKEQQYGTTEKPNLPNSGSPAADADLPNSGSPGALAGVTGFLGLLFPFLRRHGGSGK